MPLVSISPKSNVVPFSPLSDGEERVIDAYLKHRPDTAPSIEVSGILNEIGARDSVDIGRQAIEVGAGLIIGKYASGDLLPNWSIFKNGEVKYSREIDDAARKSRRLFSTVFLEINWADSGPGFSWPEQYRVTWAPRQGRWIVSASLDTDDAYGFTDVALGHFKSEQDQLIEKARPRILRHWRTLKRICNQAPWQSVTNPGLMSKELAEAWRKRVWPQDPNFYEG